MTKYVRLTLQYNKSVTYLFPYPNIRNLNELHIFIEKNILFLYYLFIYFTQARQYIKVIFIYMIHHMIYLKRESKQKLIKYYRLRLELDKTRNGNIIISVEPYHVPN